MDERGAIGFRNAIPWHLPEDLRLFRRMTLGHPVLMGRKTWDSLGRALPGRQNIVLTRQKGFVADGATAVGSLSDLAKLELMHPEVMVMGGAQVYQLLLPEMVRLLVSEVHGVHEADTFFPRFRELFSRHSVLENFADFDLVCYER